MKRKSVWFLAVMIVSLAMASLVALAAQDLEIKPPSNPPPCICPQNYEPVVCKAADGSYVTFSNACFAGCAGASHCARFSTTTGQ